MNPKAIKSGASFSPCRTWRYKLSRRWPTAGAMVAFIGLNPSTADEINDDPTVRPCIGFARRWGFGGMYMLNVFGFRSTNPRALKTAADHVGPRNNAALLSTCCRCEMVVAWWGRWGGLFDRHRAVVELLGKVPIHCLGLTQGGQPKHPLYLRSTTAPVRLALSGARIGDGDVAIRVASSMCDARIREMSYALEGRQMDYRQTSITRECKHDGGCNLSGRVW